ncbi:armadillo-type protein [Mycena rebaudengoi]|nr:armadillo-type protein [Mycena rebaudengoi]
MDEPRCIPANSDISGIGVRAAIYAQNLLCFAPVVAHLWDGNVSADEMNGVKDQSIGILAIAFAVLISTIIGASPTNIASGQGLTRFHAAVILDLSWMNNTSTWIWFLLYAHHVTKPLAHEDKKPIPAIWSAWTDVLLSPLRRLVGLGHLERTVGTEMGTFGRRQSEHESERQTTSITQRAWYFVSEKPVLTLGSIHLSLMGAIGLWLWSDPSKFGTSIGPCDPSLTVVGGAVRFSSPGLRIFSLAIYSLLVIPGLNLVPPFLFFLAFHITYNRSRKRHPHFWGRLEHFINSISRISAIFHDFHGTAQRAARALRGILRSTVTLFRRRRGPFRDSESGPQSADSPSGCSLTPSNTPHYHRATQAGGDSGETPAQSVLRPPVNRTAFLIVGLVSLAVINVILLVDIELTLRRNKRQQSREEDEWGFGQVLAVLLLIVPLRDFVTSILDIREKIKQEKGAKETIQRTFKDRLQEAVSNDTFDGYEFKGLIEQGADPNVAVQGAGQLVTLLQFAGSKGNEGLVQFILERGVEDNEGGAFHAAARNNKFGTAQLLGKGRNDSDRAKTAQRAVRLVGEELAQSPKYSNVDVRETALKCLSVLGTQAEFQEEIRAMIPMIVESLNDSNSYIREFALRWLSGIGAQSEFQQEIQAAIPMVVESLKDSNSEVQQVAVKCLAGLGAQAEFQQEIRAVIPVMAESLKDSNSDVRQAAVKCLSGFGVQAEFQWEIRAVIPMVAELLEDSDSDVRQAAVKCLSGLGAQAEFQREIRAVIPMVAELLEDSDSDVRQAAVKCLSGLGAQAELQQEIRAVIPMVVESLKKSDSDVRKAVVECLSGLGAQAKFQQEIRAVIPMLVEWLKDSDEVALQSLSGLYEQDSDQNEISAVIPIVAAVECLSGLGVQAEFQQEIRAVIPMIAESLKDSQWHVRKNALECLSGLGAQAEFQQEIRAVIPMVAESMRDSQWDVRKVAVECLSGLGTQAEFQQEFRAMIPMVVESVKDSHPDVYEAALQCLSGLRAQDREIILITVFEWGPFDRVKAIGSLLSIPRPT